MLSRKEQYGFLNSDNATSDLNISTAHTRKQADLIMNRIKESEDVSNDILRKHFANLDRNTPYKCMQSLLEDLNKIKSSKNSITVKTAKTFRQIGIFKIAEKDVYQDLETSDFWKISEDGKNVLRLFKELEGGIADKSASKKTAERTYPRIDRTIAALTKDDIRTLRLIAADKLAASKLLKLLDNANETYEPLRWGKFLDSQKEVIKGADDFKKLYKLVINVFDKKRAASGILNELLEYAEDYGSKRLLSALTTNDVTNRIITKIKEEKPAEEKPEPVKEEQPNTEEPEPQEEPIKEETKPEEPQESELPEKEEPVEEKPKEE